MINKQKIVSNRVFVLDTNKQSLAPCHPARARELLRKRKAAVFRMQPFTIILKHAIPEGEVVTDNLEIKLDPGSRTTGIALVLHGQNGSRCIMGINLIHRGISIVKELLSRRQIRRSRRNRNLRYRKPRFDNRTRNNWLSPSIVSRLSNLETWLKRFIKYTGIKTCTYEDTKFDAHKMLNKDISGKQYQQGTLQGYEVKEYLLELHKHTCQYCKGISKDPILEIEHVVPKAKGGSNSITNLTLACRLCNQSKGSKTLEEWLQSNKKYSTKLAKSRVSNIPKVSNKKRISLRDTSVMNIIRNRLPILLDKLGLVYSKSFGYITKYNRSKQNYRKDHWIDAVCVGNHGIDIFIPKGMRCLTVKANKNNNRQMTLMNRYGFPRTSSKGCSSIFGYSTGDLVKAIVSTGKYLGTYIGKISIRSTGFFQLRDKVVKYTNCKKLLSNDGYSYTYGTKIIKHIITELNQDIKCLITTKYKILKLTTSIDISIYTIQTIT